MNLCLVNTWLHIHPQLEHNFASILVLPRSNSISSKDNKDQHRTVDLLHIQEVSQHLYRMISSHMIYRYQSYHQHSLVSIRSNRLREIHICIRDTRAIHFSHMKYFLFVGICFEMSIQRLCRKMMAYNKRLRHHGIQKDSFANKQVLHQCILNYSRDSRDRHPVVYQLDKS